MDSHWINVGLPLDWTSKFDPTNHRTRAPIKTHAYGMEVNETSNYCRAQSVGYS